MKFFNCFTLQKEYKPRDHLLPIYDNTLDNDNENFRQLLFEQLCEIIKYDDVRCDITTRIEDLKRFLQTKFKNGMLPIYFQQTYYIMEEKKLKYIIFKKIHCTNIVLLIKALNEDNEDSEYSEETEEIEI